MLRGLSGPSHEPELIGGTRGSHIVVRRWPGAPSSAVYFESARDARPILIIPWNGLIMLGSTDERNIGDPDRAVATPEEIRYLLDETNALIPLANLTAGHILYTYAGVRPLPRSDASETAEITRRHIIHDHAPQVRGLRSVVGGKLTTHRSLAEEVVDAVAKDLDCNTKSATANSPLPGAEGMPYADLLATVADRIEGIGADPQMASRMADTWGTRSLEIIDFARQDPELGRSINGRDATFGGGSGFAVDSEAALNLTDVLMRRTMVGFGPTLAREQIEPIADLMALRLAWDSTERERQIAIIIAGCAD